MIRKTINIHTKHCDTDPDMVPRMWEKNQNGKWA